MGDPTRVQARGPGLQPTSNLANKPTYFDIYTAGQQRCSSGWWPGAQVLGCDVMLLFLDLLGGF